MLLEVEARGTSRRRYRLYNFPRIEVEEEVEKSEINKYKLPTNGLISLWSASKVDWRRRAERHQRTGAVSKRAARHLLSNKKMRWIETLCDMWLQYFIFQITALRGSMFMLLLPPLSLLPLPLPLPLLLLCCCCHCRCSTPSSCYSFLELNENVKIKWGAEVLPRQKELRLNGNSITQWGYITFYASRRLHDNSNHNGAGTHIYTFFHSSRCRCCCRRRRPRLQLYRHHCR